MDMKKRLVSVFTLTAALGIAGAGMAFALAGDPGSDDPRGCGHRGRGLRRPTALRCGTTRRHEHR